MHHFRFHNENIRSTIFAALQLHGKGREPQSYSDHDSFLWLQHWLRDDAPNYTVKVLTAKKKVSPCVLTLICYVAMQERIAQEKP